jgi:hypothetical protein
VSETVTQLGGREGEGRTPGRTTGGKERLVSASMRAVGLLLFNILPDTVPGLLIGEWGR